MARNVAFGPEMRRGAGDFNGEGETTGGIVVVRFGQNVLQVIDRIKAKLEEVKTSLPEGVEIVTTYDRSDLDVEIRDQRVAAEVVPLPFYRRGA